MSGSTQFDPRAAVRTAAPADSPARPIAGEAANTWICSFCGLLRVYEGGRPLGHGDRSDCRECGGRLAAMPEDWAAIAKCDTRRGSFRSLVEIDLF
jgi:hypothetical protein